MAASVSRVLSIANSLLSHVGMATRVHRLQDCNSALFAHLYAILTGDKVHFLDDGEASRCQHVVDLLSQHLADHVSLEHIRGAELAAGDCLTISHLLDVFSVLFHLHCDGHDDSNTLSHAGLSVISDVLREEGISMESYSSVSTTELLYPVSQHGPSLASTPLIASQAEQSSHLLVTLSPLHTPPHPPKPLLSPLHHSTPHATGRSRVFGQRPPSPTDPQPTTATADTSHSSTLSPNPAVVHSVTATETTLQSNAEDSTILPASQLTDDSPQADSSTGSLDLASKEDLTLDMQAALTRAKVLETLCQKFVKELKNDKAKCRNKGRYHKKKASRQRKPVETRKPPEAVGIEEEAILPLVEEQFPFVHLDPAMLRRLWQKQLQQVSALSRSRPSGQHGTATATKRVAESQQKHTALAAIIKKEVEHTRRMQRQMEQQREERAVKASIRNKRQASAKARRYFNDYELRLRAKLQRERTREEQLFRSVFEEGLALQRDRVRELRHFAKEKQQEHAKRHQEQLDAMENFYQDQLALLAERMARERAEVSVRSRAQERAMAMARRELSSRLEGEVKELQAALEREDDEMHFRELDAGTLRRKLAQLSLGQ